MPTRWVVPEGAKGARVDAELARALDVGMNEARRILASGAVRIGGRRAKKGDLVSAGTEIELVVDPSTLAREVVPEPSRALVVLYEDEAMIAVDKPAGWASHPLRAGELGTVANALVALVPACVEASDDPREGGLVHRLDRGTSGAILAAKTPAAWAALRRSFSEGEIDKTYWALTHGVIVAGDLPWIIVDEPLVTRGGTARVRRDDPEALPARTELRVLASGGGYSFVEARARTGRLHQIRAHLAYLGHPLVGDSRYGAPDAIIEEPLLHARALSVPHPVDSWRVNVAAPLPADRRATCERLLGHAIAASLKDR